ncbi:S9 family peptidase [Aquincola sp. S2]|uniref:Acyl-peptide hydrolase n=1 Tax=Pseudaquabacterium terrae TaxID=2732868 RepID=A0ABX2EAR7_9BURK|nr:S9 family peptidase [Aquabacterium terrae]NRF66185.1 S9 family peptidase [Aquabacterium terrae]
MRPSIGRRLSAAVLVSCAVLGAFCALPAAAAPAEQRAQATPPRPPARGPKRYTIEQFMATTSITGASFSADGQRLLFSSNQSGIWNAYVLPVTGGTPEPLTRSTTDSVFAVGFFPDDDRVLFTRDRAGDEQNHLFVRETDGTERDLTPGDRLKAELVAWQGDGSGFYVISNERDPKFFDLYRYDTKDYARTLVYRNEQGLNVESISRDGRWVALSKARTTADNDLHLYDTRSKTLKHLTPHQGNIRHEAQAFDPASKRLYFLSDEGSEFAQLRVVDLDDGSVRVHQKADWDIAFTYFSWDGRHRVTGINEDGSTKIRITDAATEQPLALPPLPAGQLRQVTFSKDGQRLAFYVNGDRAPNNLFVHDFKSRQLRQLTQSLAREIVADDLVEAQVLRFKSFDGLVIPSIYYRPHEATPERKVPAVIFVHGGPGGQTRRGYSAMMQHLANQGYAVLGINHRGSAGYGKSFYAADDRKHGREPLWDCIEAKAFLASLGHVDPERIAIMGGSYGGYMTLAAMAFRPEAFKVGIDIFGVSNWLRTLESIPPYWESFREALYAEIGDPVKDKEFLIATSPLFHAKEIRKPLMVIQGRNDPRVIKPESDEIVEAVKKNGVPVEYLVFDDEGHGFSKKRNELEANRRIVEFLDKHLKGGGR